jgi:hypothetical protein
MKGGELLDQLNKAAASQIGLHPMEKVMPFLKS